MPEKNSSSPTFQFSLKQDDFLAFQLYTVSKSKRSIKKRRTNWFVMVACLLLVCCMAYLGGHLTHLYFLVPFTLLVFIFYPAYQKWYYRRHYINHIREHYASKVHQSITIDLNSDFISEKSVIGDSKIDIKQVRELNETSRHLFVKISTGDSLILPKSEVDTELFKQELLKVVGREEVIVNEELGWKW